MINSTAKKGRPQGFYRATWGDRIDGLTKLTDGRWKVSGTNGGKPVKFSESDERLAVARFREMLAARTTKLGTLAVHPDAMSAALDMTKRATDAGGPLQVDIAKMPDGKGYAIRDDALSPAQWAWLRKAILNKGQWVAQRVGIEQIGWLTDVKEPVPSLTLKELIDLYGAKAGLSSNEASRSKLFWKEFTSAVGIDRIGDLTHDRIAAYEKLVTGSNYAPKSILHRYRKIRCVLAYAIKRGKGVEDCRRALDVTAMLEVQNHTPLDPRPITPAQFWAVHKAATDAGDTTYAALMLTALNCSMYGGEVAALKWDEVNLKTGELVTRRPKTGVSRVAILWPEVVAALRKVERTGDYIFNTSRRSYVVNSVLKMWRLYRTEASLGDDVVFSQIRDAGFTAACGVSLDQARVLAGHRLPGASDHYIRRAPGFVADACAAIRKAFKRK